MLLVPARMNQLTPDERDQVIEDAESYAFVLFDEDIVAEAPDPTFELVARLEHLERLERFYHG